MFELFVSFGGLRGLLALHLTACFRAAEALGKLGRLICISLAKPKMMTTKKSNKLWWLTQLGLGSEFVKGSVVLLSGTTAGRANQISDTQDLQYKA